ncbi:MAG: DUF4372 domain-containing protein [Bacteroidales bacterium]
MNQDRYIFAQHTDFLPGRVFDRIVQTYQGNKHARTFTCWNQMPCLIFSQLTNRDSMRDLLLSLEAHRSKYYHLGFSASLSHRNLRIAYENRNFKIFVEFAYVLIDIDVKEPKGIQLKISGF